MSSSSAEIRLSATAPAWLVPTGVSEGGRAREPSLCGPVQTDTAFSSGQKWDVTNHRTKKPRARRDAEQRVRAADDMPMSQRASAMRTFALLAALIGFAAAQYPPMAPAFPPAPPNVNPYQVPLSSEQVDAGDLCPAVGSSGVLRCASTSVGPTVDGEPTVDQGWQSVGAGGSCVTFAGLWCARKNFAN